MSLKTLLSVICTLLLIQITAFSQSRAKQERVSIIGTYSLKKVFDTIYDQTGVQVTYSNALINANERVSLTIKNATLDDALSAILKGKNVTWIAKEGYITIRAGTRSEMSIGKTNAIEITGYVLSEDGLPLSGATVIIKGSDRGTATDNQGLFVLREVQATAILHISYTGYSPQDVSVNGRSSLSIRLQPSTNSLDEAVVVAYGITTRRSNTGAVSVIKGESITNLPNRSIDRSLQGQVPGLLITTGSGAPGGGTSNFILRGIGTGADIRLTGAVVRQPLIVIDGVPTVSANTVQITTDVNSASFTNPLAQFNPADIENISILKDAAAIALYGSKASNGVILITTKKGKAGKTSFTFHHQTDLATPINQQDELLNRDEYLTLLRESYKNSNPTLWTDAAIETDLKSKFPNYINELGQSVFYDQQDWFKAIYKNTAATITNELSASGGSDKMIYYFNVGHTTQKGVVKHTSFDRFSLRYNFSNKPFAWFKYGLNSTITYTKQNYQKSGSEDQYNSGSGFSYIVPLLNPIRLKDGSYNLFPFIRPSRFFNNPVAAFEYNFNRTDAYRCLANLFAEFKFLKDLSFRTDLGTDILFAQIKEKFDPRLSLSVSAGPGIGQITESNPFSARIINTNTLRLNKAILNTHLIEVLMGQESQIERNKILSGTKQGLAVPSLADLSAASNIINLIGTSNRSTLLSYFGQISYSHADKYFLSFSGRRDGSSKFGINNQYGNYWSVGAGWVFSELSLFKKIKSINLAKLRASIGTSGNSASLGSSTRFDLVTPGSLFNGVSAITINPGNPAVEWERSFNKDIGLEFSLFKDRLSGTVDWYKRNISNLLYLYQLPGTSGTPSVTQNVGKMENTGLELLLSLDVVRKKTFTWNIAINWSTNENKLVKADAVLSVKGLVADIEGESFNSYYLVKWAGVNPADGKPQWYDLNGKITDTYSPDDKQIAGKPQPDGFGSIINNFKYKNWDASFMLYYQYGFKIYDYALNTLLNDGGNIGTAYFNQSKRALDRWVKPGDIAENPRRALNNVDGGSSNPSTRFLYDGDFIRLKNISVSYTIPEALTKRWKLNSSRIYIQGNNLVVLTKYKGLDPENVGVGYTQIPYPQSRSYSIGLDIKF